MFDIAFSELIVIGVVALIVIGPDKLPKVARTAGHLFGRAQRYFSDVKSDIDRELRFEELQKLQDEIRQNTQLASTGQYQVGQIIRHDLEQAKIDYQPEQMIKHKPETTDNQVTAHAQTAPVVDIPEPVALKQGAAN